MTGRRISLYRKGIERKSGEGFRCSICTGCGRCPGIRSKGRDSGIRIITQNLIGERGKVPECPGIRLAAADIGTTTVAMELFGRDASPADRYVQVNPQRKFGTDVLSRIEAGRDPEQFAEMNRSIRSALTSGAERFLKSLDPEEQLLIVIAANTTMSYFWMGWDPEELGQAPFRASHLSGGITSLTVNTEGGEKKVLCLLLPGFSAFVGSDIWAGIQAGEIQKREKITLLIDLGTNGEIALGNRERLITCATAAGPAFEGGATSGIWGADLIKFTAELLKRGILDETGLLAEPYFEQGIRVGNVLMTQEAVRSLQCAKAAIAAGISILLREYGILPKEVDEVILAGGFGYFLNPEDAEAIGLLPGNLSARTIAGGNTALYGAGKSGIALLEALARRRNGELTEEELMEVWEPEEKCFEEFRTYVKVLNLAEQPGFRELYVDYMALKPWNL